jgi:lipid-A-disaccharide synthase
LARRLVKIPHVSLPNILSEGAVVPELLQEEATPERLGQELFMLLRHPVLRQQQTAQFDAVRARLKCGAGERAAAAIGQLLGR